MLRSLEAPPAKITGAGQKNRWVSLSRKRASLLGKFPVLVDSVEVVVFFQFSKLLIPKILNYSV
jgi:hypothetical protein